MRRDEQTHVLPEEIEGIGTIATMMAFPSREVFEEAYRAALATVSGYYAQLFSEGESLGAGEGDLVFTGSDDDPGTLQTLAAMGFADPKTVSATVRKWHYGGYLATRASASRAHLTELLPSLLRTFVESGAPDAALKRFDEFLARLPAGVQLFSLLRRNDSLRTLLVRFLASAPRMAEAVIHRAHVMDALIDPAYADEISRPAALVRRVDGFLSEARTYEELIDRARIIGGEQKFLLCASLLSGRLSGARAGELFTALAETLLGRLFAAVRGEFAKRHGIVPGAPAALLSFGKMASREMTVTSDLDFILLYDVQSTDESDGDKPLAASHYFTRLTQRLVAALSAPTAEGVLYQADMRLRPSGNAGPLATSISGFLGYQKESAWSWEHLALSRARVIVADPGFRERIEAGIAEVLSRSRDVPKTIDDVVSMRALMAKERPPRHPFDLKLISGGLVDLEFIAQSAQLVAFDRIERPQAPVNLVLARMGEIGLLPQSERLVEIHRLYGDILQIMSAALLQPLKEEGWDRAFRDLLTGLVNYPDFERLRSDLADMQQTVIAASKEWYARAANLD
jgi:glutamate-ammonia-ligase adenylyltransferase